MLTWLRPRPTRRAARPAQVAERANKPRQAPAPPIEDDLPPPFFADGDTAFLDLGDDRQTPPPLPRSAIARQASVDLTTPIRQADSIQKQLADALLALPSYPARNARDRTRQLIEIFRSLDRIASTACENVQADRSPG